MQEDWIEDLAEILAGSNLNEDADHIFMMFSATFPAKYRHVAKKYMASDFLRIKAGRCGSAHANIKQKVMWVDGNRKNEALYDVLFAHPPGRTMVFVNSKAVADKIDDFLYNADLPSASLHSDRTQNEREDAISNFRSGVTPILVTTGVAARGIDIAHVLHVINYDLPSTMHGGIDEYVHRIGRTGRLGHVGLATSFYNERNDELAPDLVKILMETDQEVPDFLEEFKPLDGAVTFEEGDSDEEDDGGFGGAAPAADGGDAGAGGDSWGGGAAATNGDAANGGDAWGGGGSATNGESSGFKADEGFGGDDGGAASGGW
jgi:ATP-dependent RNA helicase DDX3X